MVAARSVGRERPREVHGGGDDAGGQWQQRRRAGPSTSLSRMQAVTSVIGAEPRVAQPSSERFGAGRIVGAVEDQRGRRSASVRRSSRPGQRRIGEARRDRLRAAADAGELQRLEQAHGDDGVGDLVTRRAARGAPGRRHETASAAAASSPRRASVTSTSASSSARTRSGSLRRAGVGNDRGGLMVDDAADDGRAGHDDAGLLARRSPRACRRVAPCGRSAIDVMAAYGARDDVGGIVAAAEPDLDDGDLHARPRGTARRPRPSSARSRWPARPARRARAARPRRRTPPAGPRRAASSSTSTSSIAKRSRRWTRCGDV